MCNCYRSVYMQKRTAVCGMKKGFQWHVGVLQACKSALRHLSLHYYFKWGVSPRPSILHVYVVHLYLTLSKFTVYPTPKS